MRSPLHIPLPLLALLLCTLTISACGSSDSVIHIDGSSASISKPTLNHWMKAFVGEDFRQVIGTKGPIGLAAEPANYGECATAAKKVIPRSFAGHLKLNDEQIRHKCVELAAAVKEQAMSFLISVQWEILMGAEQGIHISEAQVHREFARTRKARYPTEADLQIYLSDRHLALSDVLYELKRNMLVRGILPKFEARVARAGGGEARYTELALKRYKGLVAKTSCKAGYVAPSCRQYREGGTHPPPPNVTLEQFVKGESG